MNQDIVHGKARTLAAIAVTLWAAISDAPPLSGWLGFAGAGLACIYMYKGYRGFHWAETPTIT